VLPGLLGTREGRLASAHSHASPASTSGAALPGSLAILVGRGLSR
jgi:hypothetical protein